MPPTATGVPCATTHSSPETRSEATQVSPDCGVAIQTSSIGTAMTANPIRAAQTAANGPTSHA